MSRKPTHPSWAGQVSREASNAVHILSPSNSNTTIGSSNGNISKMSPSVMFPMLADVGGPNAQVFKGFSPGPYTESPRSVPAQMSTPSVPPQPFMQRA